MINKQRNQKIKKRCQKLEKRNEPVDKSFDHVIWKELTSVYKRIHNDLDTFLSRFGIGMIEWRVLKILSEEERSPMVNLAEQNFITQPWITGIIDKMEEGKLVERVRSKDDRRIINVEMRPEGKELFNRVRDQYEEKMSNFLSVLNDDEKIAFRNVLEKIRNNFNE